MNERIEQVMNQEGLQEQIQDTIQTRMRKQLMINQTMIDIEPGRISIQAQATNMISVSSERVSIEGMNIEEDVPTRINEKNISIMREENKVRIHQEGTNTNVTLRLNHKIMIQNNTMYLNASGTMKELTVLPEQAMNQARVRNQNMTQVELEIEDNIPKYNIMEQKRVRILGIIPANMNVTTKINAQNNNIENVRRPWWSFLSVEE